MTLHGNSPIAAMISLDAASGKQRNTISASLATSLIASTFLRSSSAVANSSISFLSDNRS